MAEWLGIETAPRDGRPILTFHPYDWAARSHKPPLAVIRWDEDCDCWIYAIPGNYVQGVEIEPTLWMPIEPPHAGRVEGEGR